MTLKEFLEEIEDLITVYGTDIEVKTSYLRYQMETPVIEYDENKDCIVIL